MVTIGDIQNICQGMPSVTQDIKWEDHLCFNVGGKMFLITSPDQFPVTAWFKTSSSDFQSLTQLEGFVPAPYLARHQWVAVDDIRRFTISQWSEYLVKSYELVTSKFSLKLQRKLGISN
jgi:predicted DNA-binding protein (MmcQ/YjbR family)